jgi:hypothetical protein
VHRVRSEPFSNPSAPGRNYRSVLLHKVCADWESNPESPESEARIPLNIIVNRPQTNCATRDEKFLKCKKLTTPIAFVSALTENGALSQFSHVRQVIWQIRASLGMGTRPSHRLQFKKVSSQTPRQTVHAVDFNISLPPPLQRG